MQGNISLLRLYYLLRPIIPRKIQILLRRKRALYKKALYSHVWPIDERAGNAPSGWKGWPDNKRFALVLTHDVESQKGVDRCYKLVELDRRHGFVSAFNFVAEDYKVSPDLRQFLKNNGFEVGIHGLHHDGKLYLSRNIFKRQAKKINQYIKKWKVAGFRSPSMHYNLEWIHDLNIEYDASTFDTDPFEPQSEGMRTIFPFIVSLDGTDKRYVELPYTLPQDFTLFIIFREQSIDIWKKKLDWIVEKGGMALLITHPDYMDFSNNGFHHEEYPVRLYEDFLRYVRSRYGDQYWNALPKEVARFCLKEFSEK